MSGLKVKNRLLSTDINIYQDSDWFKFSLDSVLLAKFVTINLRTKKIIDLATGNAPIPLLLTFRTKATIYGVEYQECIYDLAKESVEDSGLTEQVKLINADVRYINKEFESDTFDVVTCNPPYFKTINKEYLNDNYVKSVARHEIKLNLEEVVKSASYLLKNGGSLAMVHRTERFVEILEVLKKYHIEPKRVQFIYPKEGLNSDLFLIEGTKNGKVGLKLLPPLIVHKDDNSYTDEVNKILEF